MADGSRSCNSQAAKTCTKCEARLPLARFQGHKTTCSLCTTAERRIREPLRPLKPDPRVTVLNNLFNLWHGPVSPAPLRSAA